jgi:hypothetical protein
MRLFPGYVAMAAFGAALNAKRTDWSRLCGRKVTIWPDRDEPGTVFARDVSRLALAGVLRVEWVSSAWRSQGLT